MKLKFALCATVIISSFAVSASESNGKVIDYWVHNFHDSFAFSIENQTGRPACASYGAPSGRYVVDTRTERGKMVASAVMAAKASQAMVAASGFNTCDYYGDSEDLRWIRAY